MHVLKSSLWREDDLAEIGPLARAIGNACDALLAAQRADGHWLFELEADATIPAEYILLLHCLGEENPALEAKIAAYLRRTQGSHGGWPLVHGGRFNISASVKTYFALKMAGDSPDAPHMRRARDAILAHGGAQTCNVFTRILLALYGVMRWNEVPVIPVEIMHLPRWSPFHISKISYWGRTVLVPLLVLQTLKPRARNGRGTRLDELFVRTRGPLLWKRKGPHQTSPWFELFALIDAALHLIEPLLPKGPRQRAIDKAVAFVTERLDPEAGFGAIFPATANALLMFDALGYPPEHPHRACVRNAIEALVVVRDDEAYCQPCVSPVWDTVLASHALMEARPPRTAPAVARGLNWLLDRQVLTTRGDWVDARPNAEPGGWAFQYANPHYPDLDDTAVVVMALDRYARSFAASAARSEEAIVRARRWVIGLQSANGGWGAFDADNTREYLNHIPFADHGALLDPPTADVTARCIGMLAQLGDAPASEPLASALACLYACQRDDGSWYGRWGVNYIYGTWSALCALAAVGVDHAAPAVRRAVRWLVDARNEDGGWGEDVESYSLNYQGYTPATSCASQTAWALLALMAAGEVAHPAVERGIDYLVRQQGADGFWQEERYTGTGFPRVFYLRYHGYSKFFPLWALARYRNLLDGKPALRLGL